MVRGESVTLEVSGLGDLMIAGWSGAVNVIVVDLTTNHRSRIRPRAWMSASCGYVT